MLSETELDALAEGIKTEGQKVPICLYRGQILDGRNRFRACERAGIKPVFEEYCGNNPLGHVVQLNLKRRHMNDDQRAMVAARLANMTHGGDRKSKPDQTASWRVDPPEPINSTEKPVSVSVPDAAKLLNVSERSVERAKHILKHHPETPCGMESPHGLFGNEINTLKNCVDHEHKNHGPSGMVYWRVESLKPIARYTDVF